MKRKKIVLVLMVVVLLVGTAINPDIRVKIDVDIGMGDRGKEESDDYPEREEFSQEDVVITTRITGLNNETGEEVSYTKVLEDVMDEIKKLEEAIAELMAEQSRLYDKRREIQIETFRGILSDVVNRSMVVEFETEENKTFREMYREYASLFNTRYSTEIDNRTNSSEYLQTVQELIGNGYAGDCDDYALFLYVMGVKMEIDIRYVVSSNHAWIEIKENGEWMGYNSVYPERYVNELCEFHGFCEVIVCLTHEENQPKQI